jgi:hypothetical protein
VVAVEADGFPEEAEEEVVDGFPEEVEEVEEVEDGLQVEVVKLAYACRILETFG